MGVCSFREGAEPGEPKTAAFSIGRGDIFQKKKEKGKGKRRENYNI